MTARRRFEADWVLPIEGAPIRAGAVLVGADGRIEAVGAAADLPAAGDLPVLRFPDAILVPGLVNAHTHLELTGLAGRVAAERFSDWIRGVIEVKHGRTPDDFLAAAHEGLRDCFRGGVTTVADCGDSGAVVRALAEGGGRGIAYHEVFGPDPAQCGESMAGLRRRVGELARWADGGRVRLGVSPHAPYSVSGPLYREASRWARAEGMPLAVHVAESDEETALLAGEGGGFAAMWQRRGIACPPAPGCTPLAWLERHEVLGPDTLCIHAVRADAGDVARLAAHRCAVAHCPLSNAAHRHGAAPLAAFLEAGLRVGLGTDSVVSVGALDLLAEARAARALAGLDAAAALELCTLGGARTLGMEREIGSLARGKWADLAVVDARALAADEAAAAVLAAGSAAVRATYVAGREVWRRPAAEPAARVEVAT
jgi:5-methylthioadenosine/S-adenosylhomocysteine deaminase